MALDGPDGVSSQILELFTSLGFRPPQNQYTILASFILSSRDHVYKVISLATGSKCLPTTRLSEQGDALHDSHAEILARRAAIRWILEEIIRLTTHGESRWIQRQSDRKFCLREDVQIHMYISTLPCGDASTRFLASQQNEEMAALKDSTPFPSLPPNIASRGRDNYTLYGVLRTKPGRADSPPTNSMSCSDKIAAWNVVGFQGALASSLVKPMYITSLIVGDVDGPMREKVREDCDRALWKRIQGLNDLPPGYQLCRPQILFTSKAFQHSRTVLTSTHAASNSCNESLCWVADSIQPHDILINGLKRGVSPKHRHNAKFRPLCSKICLFQLYRQTISTFEKPDELGANSTYFDCKHSMADYQEAKRVLMGEGGPFSGWIKTGKEWENFNLQGEISGRIVS